MKFNFDKFLGTTLSLRGKQKNVFAIIHQACIFNKSYKAHLEDFLKETGYSQEDVEKALDTLARKDYIEYEIKEGKITAKALRLANEGYNPVEFRKNLLKEQK